MLGISVFEYTKGTWIESEEASYPNGGMKRRCKAIFPDGKLRICQAGIADTYFTIPAHLNIYHKGQQYYVSGYITIEEGEIDFVSMDVKAPLDPFRYSRSIGLPIHLNPILESIEILKRGKVECEFRMTVVPGFHREEDIQTLGDQLRVGRRFVLQNFNPENPLDPSLKNVVPYDQKVLKKIEREVQEIL